MTKKQKTLMKSMLNYYEIDTDGTRDERMKVDERKQFLDELTLNYDTQVIQEIIKKVRDNIRRNFQQSEEEMRMMDEMAENEFGGLKDEELEMEEEDFTSNMPPQNEKEASKYKAEVDEFINWLSNLLHTTNHKVIITQDGLNTTIQLLNLKSGKKK